MHPDSREIVNWWACVSDRSGEPSQSSAWLVHELWTCREYVSGVLIVEQTSKRSRSLTSRLPLISYTAHRVHCTHVVCHNCANLLACSCHGRADAAIAFDHDTWYCDIQNSARLGCGWVYRNTWTFWYVFYRKPINGWVDSLMYIAIELIQYSTNSESFWRAFKIR